ncbi:FAD-binding protein [Brevibacterium sp. CS2]|uniref:FAD-binding protein n=1 Tax=Brevibacterium sp. CS2 TaxID=2575923 RepID=UPI0010C79246|nr:FAD-binding protein [Brevibacterium sp. CS2]QCP04612.1 FAD-binding protein [Brevibacterium sp. CS2]
MGALTGAPTGGTGRARRVSTWSGTAHAHPAAFHAPADESELVAVVAVVAAANGSGERIRVIGAGHSFTPVALGTGTMISLDALSGIVAVDAATRRVRFRAGTRLRDIPALLAPHGLALANQGDVDPQSLVGAISTGTHGTGRGFTGFAGMVTGLTLLTADGARRELSRAADPDVFDLARLSLGVLGVITEIELACVPRFDVVAREQSEPFDDLLATFVARSAQCDHLEFYWFPHTDRALVKTNVRVAPGQAPPAGVSAARPRRRLAQLLNEEVRSTRASRTSGPCGRASTRTRCSAAPTRIRCSPPRADSRRPGWSAAWRGGRSPAGAAAAQSRIRYSSTGLPAEP